MQRQNEGKRVKAVKRNIFQNKFTMFMQKKLVILFIMVLLAFIGLSFRLFTISRDNKDTYQKKILSQQKYDSKTIPYKRGNIEDANGSLLAVSEKVYNVIVDNKVMLDDEKNVDPTVRALVQCFGLNETELRNDIKEHPDAQYKTWAKRLPFDEISKFKELQENAENKAYIKGVWFEEEYIRNYPNNSLAADVIGFVGTDNNGTYGLEEYYNEYLNGTNGREYGYLNEDATLERSTVPAVDGNTLVTSIDANIQSIVEKYILQFNEEHKDEYREGNGSTNTGCIVMNPNNGDVLAMASYPTFDLNNPRDLTPFYTAEEIKAMEEQETTYDALNEIWRNYCINSTYEPGSTAKSLTVAMGLETGKIKGNETYLCNGILEVGDYKIKCNVRTGHGELTVSGALEKSCNVALMYMGETIGKNTFLKYQDVFNLGLKTNIDLKGEARTASLVFNDKTMGNTELATSSFGQGYNVTMIQMAAAFSSIINGGYYYEPHVVKKIVNESGATVKNIEPHLVKQTISESTSEQMKQYLYATVAEGTGKSARPSGYAIGGKTGTAEKFPRGTENYVVSFIGYAPANDPQVVVYVVIDEPNVADQPHATYATGIVRNILTEVLPYLNVFMTEEMTVAEQEELANWQIVGSPVAGTDENTANPDETTDGEAADSENGEQAGDAQGSEGSTSTNGNAGETGDAPTAQEGQGGGIPTEGDGNDIIYEVDPETGELINPVTGEVAEGNDSFFEEGNVPKTAGEANGVDEKELEENDSPAIQ